MYGNPFSAVLASKTFLPTGREAILREVAQVITLPNPDSRDLHGLPGMGKTDILRYISGPEFIARYSEAFFPSYDEKPWLLFRVFVEGWSESIHPFVLLYRKFIRAYGEYRGDMAAKHPDVVLPDAPLAEIDDMDGNKAVSLMEPLLRNLKNTPVRVVLLLDEFDEKWAYGNLEADETSRLSSWKTLCSFILATERQLEDVNTRAKGSPFYKRLTPAQVRDFLPQEAREFVDEILKRGEVSLPEEDIAELLRLAGGFAYLLILGGRALWDLRQRMELGDSPKKPLPDALRSSLEGRLAVEFERMFELYYDRRAGNGEHQVLFDLAVAGSVSVAEAPAAQRVLLAKMEQYGLVDLDQNGQATLFSPLFQDWLKRQGPPREEAVVAAGDTEPDLTGYQTNIHNVLRDKPDKLVTFEELGQRVWSWPPDYRSTDIDKRKIQIAVSKLRRALERAATGEHIVNVRGRGYRYEPAR